MGGLTPAELRKRRVMGETYGQIAREFGKTESAVKSMARRAGLMQPYAESSRLPFYVKPEHKRDGKNKAPYPYRMLLIRASILEGEEVAVSQRKKHDDWMAKLRREQAVVLYLPDGLKAGWHYVDGDPDAGDWPVHDHTMQLAV